MRKEYNNIINKFREFKKRFDKVDQEIDMDSSSMNFCDESNDSSTHHKYKIYPNIYNWFNRSERRVLKRNGINIDNYVRDDIINYDDCWVGGPEYEKREYGASWCEQADKMLNNK